MKQNKLKNWMMTCTTHQAYQDGYSDAYKNIEKILAKTIKNDDLIQKIRKELMKNK